ncbi:MAG: ArsI/CadI family heavy metal resistance metalloenzyme [Gammaproteobacteria bacterium]|nr:ArsI/CadI family heavy metal resistance metalloenzyme [Gammaproteobacteria bacterium]
MKRLHLHISVAELQPAVDYYSRMFASAPDKLKQDYARWLLDEPQINFAISTRSNRVGLDHLGIQVDDESELNDLHERVQGADDEAGSLQQTTCCYAVSTKAWSIDPAGIPWESFLTMQDAELYGINHQDAAKSSQACCSGAAPRPDGSGCC